MEIGYRDHRRAVELDAPLATVVIGQIVKGDDNADRIVVALTNGGKAADLTGYSADGLFYNALGQPVPLEATISGSEIHMVLSGGCYDVSGAAAGHVRLIGSGAGQIRTVLRFVTDVLSDGSGDPYDPDAVIGDVETLLAKLTAMETATADGIAAAQEARNAGAQAIADANAAGDAAKATAQAAADDATAAAETARSTIYTRAMAIPDESALAASHELHAQKDYPLNVAVHGFTYQEGEGDPSPDNVRPIHGMDAAQVRAGGKNLIANLNSINIPGVTAEKNADGSWTLNGTVTATREGYTAITTNEVWVAPGTYTISNIMVTKPGMTFAVVSWPDGKSAPWTIQDGYRIHTGTTEKALRLGWYYYAREGVVFDNFVFAPMLVPGTVEAPYEPYLANTADLPLLPDNSPLMDGDTVENWVKSGCDKKVVLDGSEDYISMDSGYLMVGLSEKAPPVNTSNQHVYVGACSSRYKSVTWPIFSTNQVDGICVRYGDGSFLAIRDSNITTTQQWREVLSANPLTVFYRSTDYTPDKDLRVCRVVRKKAFVELTEATEESSQTGMFIAATPDKYKGKLSSSSSNEKCNAFKPTSLAWANFEDLRIRYASGQLRFKWNEMIGNVDGVNEFLAVNPVWMTVPLATPETYVTDPLPLLPPAALESDTVTVTGSGETEVEYAHETKHYIDSQIAAAVALALNG